MISIIVAVAQNQAIGKNNDLLWHLPTDMAFFKEKTKGHCIITGRKNYESIPAKFRPLPNRTNIVITRQAEYNGGGAEVVSSLDDALAFAKTIQNEEIFIIGGGEIYRQALPLVDTIYLTRVHHSFEADTFFPELDDAIWQEVESIYHEADERHAYAFSFTTLVRRQATNKSQYL